ncbi:MAG: polysaccharide deacetylase family protein [Eubacteriales bacterium]|nr:polysaccharide deacetylase family protein [Eubacteriales bacterium]
MTRKNPQTVLNTFRSTVLRRAVVFAAAISLFSASPAFAEWQNEAGGPGEAVWISDGADTAQPAPGANNQYLTPDGGSYTYVDGHPVHVTGPDGTVQEAPAPGAPEAEGSGNPETGVTTPGETPTPEGSAQTPETAPETSSVPETVPESVPETAPETTPEAVPETQNAGTADTSNSNLVMSNGRQLDLTKPMIALTYDDGPYAPVGNRIMAAAEQHNGRVTFFMVGSRVRSYTTEVKRMVSGGHEVANHTYDHKYLNKLDAASIRSQVVKCNDVIEEVSGVRPTLMRLPGGNKNKTVLSNVNMPIILWNIDTRDWATKNTQSTINAVLGKIKDGDIVLMHELYSSTAAATEALIPALAKQGFQFVTVSELAKFKGKTLGANQIYYSL